MAIRNPRVAAPQAARPGGAPPLTPATKDSSAAPADGSLVVNPPPVPGAPHRAATFVPLTGKEARTLRKPAPTQVSSAPAIAAGCRGMAAAGTYVLTFGPSVPPAEVLAAAIVVAAAWSDEHAQATEWQAYAQRQRLTGWQHVFTLMAQFKPVFEAIAPRMPGLATALPAVTSFLGVAHTRGVKAAATRMATAPASTAKAARAVTRAQKQADKAAAKAARTQHAADAARLAADQQRAAAVTAAQNAALRLGPVPAPAPTPPTHP